MVIINKTNKIQVICPICKTKDVIGIPKRGLNNKSNLTTISIHKGFICPHHFQIFMDKSFQIRGYQKVDFELNQENSTILWNGVKAFNQNEKENSNLFENLIFDGNNVKYSPLTYHNNSKLPNRKPKRTSIKKVMTLKDIYEEFWEFIDEENEEFREFILIDKRRINLHINPDYSEVYNHINLESKNQIENF